MNPKNYRFRRFIALVIDWNICAIPAFLFCRLLYPLVVDGKLPIPVLIPFMVSYPVLFLFRERLFKGRSLGNRIMKLVVLDRRTLQPLSPSALKTRNMMFLFLSVLDLLLLLTTGSSLGDRAVAAVVVPQDEIPTEPPRKEPANTKTILATVLAVVVGISLFIGMILLSLERVKEEPHYALAHDYLLQSEAFYQLDAEEDQIRLTGYSRNTYTRNGITDTDASFTFQVKGHPFIVICHPTEDGWYICEECTQFR